MYVCMYVCIYNKQLVICKIRETLQDFFLNHEETNEDLKTNYSLFCRIRKQLRQVHIVR